MVELKAKLNMDDNMYKQYQNGEVELRGAVFGNDKIQPYQELEIIDEDNSEKNGKNLSLVVGGAALVLGGIFLYNKMKPKITNMIEERQAPSQLAVDNHNNFNTAYAFYLSDPNNLEAISELQYCISRLKYNDKKDSRYLKKHTQEAVTQLLSHFEPLENKKLKKIKFEEKLNKLNNHFNQIQKEVKKQRV